MGGELVNLIFGVLFLKNFFFPPPPKITGERGGGTFFLLAGCPPPGFFFGRLKITKISNFSLFFWEKGKKLAFGKVIKSFFWLLGAFGPKKKFPPIMVFRLKEGEENGFCFFTRGKVGGKICYFSKEIFLILVFSHFKRFIKKTCFFNFFRLFPILTPVGKKVLPEFFTVFTPKRGGAAFFWDNLPKKKKKFFLFTIFLKKKSPLLFGKRFRGEVLFLKFFWDFFFGFILVRGNPQKQGFLNFLSGQKKVTKGGGKPFKRFSQKFFPLFFSDFFLKESIFEKKSGAQGFL